MEVGSPGKALYRTRRDRKSSPFIQESPPATPLPPPEVPVPKLPLKILAKIIAEFVPVDDIFSNFLYIVCKELQRSMLKCALVFQPLDESRRRWFWLQVCGRVDKIVEMEANRLGIPSEQSAVFTHYLHQPRTAEAINEIERDVVRTMPSHPLFSVSVSPGTEMNREKLRSVLLAVSAAEPSVGYCQGMNFVAATLLLNLGMNEEDSFLMFLSILKNFHFRHLYSPSVPLLPLRMFTFSRLVRQHLPQVWHHLNSKTFSVEIFANQWIMTLFGYYIDSDILGPYLWSIFFLVGWKFIFQIGLAILAILEPTICAMDVEEISTFMASSRTGCDGHPFSKKELVKSQIFLAIEKFHITNSDLERLGHQFLAEKLIGIVGDENIVAMVNGKFDLKQERPTNLVESGTRTTGFSWLRSPVDNSPVFLRIDPSSLSTPNRPHERLHVDVSKTVDVPVVSLRQMQRTVELVANSAAKDMTKATTALKDIEKRLNGENKQFNVLVGNASKLDDVFKDVAKRKAALTDALKDAVTKSNSDENSTLIDIPKSVKDLMKAVSEIENEYDAKKEQRGAMYEILGEQEKKISEIAKEKSAAIVRISKMAADLEDTQHEIIYRSIQSAIDSFSSGA